MITSGRIPPPPYTTRPPTVRNASRAPTPVLSPDAESVAPATPFAAEPLYGFWIDRPDAVYHRAVVSFRWLPPESGNNVCTEPFPNVVRPTTSARSLS